MSGFFENVVLRLSRLFGFCGQRAQVLPVEGVDLIVASQPDLVVASVVAAATRPITSSRQFKLAKRLAYVAKVQRWKNGKKPKPVGKARANLKPKPVVAGGVAKKRGPSLFPTKMTPVTARKATTRIYIEKKPKKSAEIVTFPIRKPLPGAPRLKRAA